MADTRRRPAGAPEKDRSPSPSTASSDSSDDETTQHTLSVELAFAREIEDVPAICSDSWSLWDGGQAGGKPVRGGASARRVFLLPNPCR
jgi:hypothetical protein